MVDTGKPSRARRPYDAEATRRALLHAATRRFTVLGYGGTTTRDIADDAGVNVALIARYFGSKEGLFAEVVRESAAAMDTDRGAEETDLLTSVLDGLRADAWEEFGGQHPLMLIMRDNGDSEKVGDLRERALQVAIERLAPLVSPAPQRAGGRRQRKAAVALRAETVAAVVVGLHMVRSALPQGALATSSPRQLRELVEGLLGSLAP